MNVRAALVAVLVVHALAFVCVEASCGSVKSAPVERKKRLTATVTSLTSCNEKIARLFNEYKKLRDRTNFVESKPIPTDDNQPAPKSLLSLVYDYECYNVLQSVWTKCIALPAVSTPKENLDDSEKLKRSVWTSNFELFENKRTGRYVDVESVKEGPIKADVERQDDANNVVDNRFLDFARKGFKAALKKFAAGNFPGFPTYWKVVVNPRGPAAGYFTVPNFMEKPVAPMVGLVLSPVITKVNKNVDTKFDTYKDFTFKQKVEVAVALANAGVRGGVPNGGAKTVCEQLYTHMKENSVSEDDAVVKLAECNIGHEMCHVVHQVSALKKYVELQDDNVKKNDESETAQKGLSHYAWMKEKGFKDEFVAEACAAMVYGIPLSKEVTDMYAACSGPDVSAIADKPIQNFKVPSILNDQASDDNINKLRVLLAKLQKDDDDAYEAKQKLKENKFRSLRRHTAGKVNGILQA